jgi:two-component system invasion response regulator UvrY
MIRVFVVDDHAIVRRGIKQILDDCADCSLVGEAATGAEALGGLRDTPCDVVVLDISLPGQSGLELLPRIRREFPRLKVLMLTMHREEQYAIRLLKAGASGYLTKDGVPEDLVAAIRRVASGGRFLTPSLAERMAAHLDREVEKPPHERLSDREFQVFCLMAEGKSLTEIAYELGVSVKTISTHRTRILEKTGFRNNAELVQYAVRNGLIG